jgi:hypothetical protein
LVQAYLGGEFSSAGGSAAGSVSGASDSRATRSLAAISREVLTFVRDTVTLIGHPLASAHRVLPILNGSLPLLEQPAALLLQLRLLAGGRHYLPRPSVPLAARVVNFLALLGTIGSRLLGGPDAQVDSRKDPRRLVGLGRISWTP